VTGIGDQDEERSDERDELARQIHIFFSLYLALSGD
jgi:hypothetical protein